ncbi:MAG: lipid A deacylase LpxR family protein [Gammaproteobacteria bacterium]|nr:lipid A deacylase LpxR family protein [Gammaproteobacteria bacterium]
MFGTKKTRAQQSLRACLAILSSLLAQVALGAANTDILDSTLILGHVPAKPTSNPPLLLASQVENEQFPQVAPLTPERKEKDISSWTVYVDNDGFAPGRRDRDYTGGISISLSGALATESWLSLDRPLAPLDAWHQLDSDTIVLHGLEFGLTAFTPERISRRTPLYGQRPYASLIYLGNSRQYIDANTGHSRVSSLTLGILGLSVAQELQQNIHKHMGGRQPRGWDYQISDGGEPTLRYSVAWNNILDANYSSDGIEYEIVTTQKLNIGYLTDGAWGLSARIGRLETPWWSFSPQLAEYSEYSKPSAILPDKRSKEMYFWTGFNLRARLYNVFLQGQFRDSTVTLRSDELNHIIGDAWAGVTCEFSDGWRASYFMRGQTSEVKNGPSDHNNIWGGFILGRTY